MNFVVIDNSPKLDTVVLLLVIYIHIIIRGYVMQTYEQVDNYMKALDLKYYKGTNDFLASLMLKTDKGYVKELADTLNSRAQGQNSDNEYFYKLKNRTLDGSLCVSAAFDSGLFRHLGNMIIDGKEYFHGTVLDIGCDCGLVSCFIAQQYPECKVVGVDKNETAVNNAKKLAERLGLANAEFVTADIYDFNLDEKAEVATSFRGLLDIAQCQTSGVSVIGERSAREGAYQQAFLPLATAIGNNLKDGGTVISVERYTAMYGWLGWMQALSLKLPKGRVAYSFNAASVIGADGYISEGDKVDVLVYDGVSQKSRIAYKNLDILRVSTATASKTASESGKTVTDYNTLTVSVTEKQALKLYKIENENSFKLVLKHRENVVTTQKADAQQTTAAQ